MVEPVAVNHKTEVRSFHSTPNSYIMRLTVFTIYLLSMCIAFIGWSLIARWVWIEEKDIRVKHVIFGGLMVVVTSIIPILNTIAVVFLTSVGVWFVVENRDQKYWFNKSVKQN